ncbi:MAG: trimeric intracellular cation channel family protein [Rhodocyclaceae bacterium]|nr:trimeric intracellular cation channel family protein [Rhodocyclaceae bacterium]
MSAIETLLYGIGLAGVAVNAASGVLEAGRKPFDMFGMVIVALAAALGGGTLRDLLLDRTVFWIADQSYLVCAILAGMLSFAAARHWRLPPRLFLLPDAVGLALFTVSGTKIALALGTPWLVASAMGVVTGVVGGILRDVLCNEEPVVFSGQLYATPSWLGALLLVGLTELGVSAVPAALAAGTFVLLVRLVALRFDLRLPIYSARL